MKCSSAVVVGEATGGVVDCYGDVRSFRLPNCQIPVYYSIKYFQSGKVYGYKNGDNKTFTPELPITQSIDDYRRGVDTVLEYVLKY